MSRNNMKMARGIIRERDTETIALKKAILKTGAQTIYNREQQENLAQMLTESDDLYNQKMAQLNKFKSKSKVATKVKTLKGEWLSEQSRLEKMAIRCEGDIAKCLEATLLLEPHFGELHSLVAEWSTSKSAHKVIHSTLSSQLHEVKGIVQEMQRHARRDDRSSPAEPAEHRRMAPQQHESKQQNQRKEHQQQKQFNSDHVQQTSHNRGADKGLGENSSERCEEAATGSTSSSGSNSSSSAGDDATDGAMNNEVMSVREIKQRAAISIIAELLMQLRTDHAEQWEQLKQTEAALVSEAKEYRASITSALRHDQISMQNEALRKEFAKMLLEEIRGAKHDASTIVSSNSFSADSESKESRAAAAATASAAGSHIRHELHEEEMRDQDHDEDQEAASVMELELLMAEWFKKLAALDDAHNQLSIIFQSNRAKLCDLGLYSPRAPQQQRIHSALRMAMGVDRNCIGTVSGGNGESGSEEVMSMVGQTSQSESQGDDIFSPRGRTSQPCTVGSIDEFEGGSSSSSSSDRTALGRGDTPSSSSSSSAAAAAAYGGWSKESHDAFVKVFKRAQQTGTARKVMLEMLQAELRSLQPPNVAVRAATRSRATKTTAKTTTATTIAPAVADLARQPTAQQPPHPPDEHTYSCPYGEVGESSDEKSDIGHTVDKTMGSYDIGKSTAVETAARAEEQSPRQQNKAATQSSTAFIQHVYSLDEILAHEDWYRKMQSLSRRYKEEEAQYLQQREELVAAAKRAVQEHVQQQKEFAEKERQLRAHEAGRAELHTKLFAMRVERDQISAEKRAARELQLARERERERVEWEATQAEHREKKDLVEKYRRLKDEEALKAKLAMEEESKRLQEQLHARMEEQRPQVERRAQLVQEKNQQKKQREVELGLQEARRMEILSKLAQQVPYWESIQNVDSKLDHITASVRAQAYVPRAEGDCDVRGHMPMNGFTDQRVISDSRFKLAKALYDAGIQHSSAARNAVAQFHPRPHLAIHGII